MLKAFTNVRGNLISKRFFSSGFQQAKLPDLPYDYNALEPVISAQIMQLHHSKHHNAYVTNYNKAVEELLDAQAKGDHSKICSLQGAIKFNGGGHINHSIFWTNLAPKNKQGGTLPGSGSKLSQQVSRDFGSFDNLIAEFTKKAGSIQGSGWGWLAYNKSTKSLILQEQPNQDPLILTGHIPLLGIDVWEHAFYLQYLNNRPEYLKKIWEVVNWSNVEERYLAATQ